MGINNNIKITQLSPKIQEILNKNAATITNKVKIYYVMQQYLKC